jgi:hypothetical protein
LPGPASASFLAVLPPPDDPAQQEEHQQERTRAKRARSKNPRLPTKISKQNHTLGATCTSAPQTPFSSETPAVIDQLMVEGKLCEKFKSSSSNTL